MRYFTAFTLFIVLLGCTDKDSAQYFKSASAVWPSGLQNEKNITTGFRSVFSSDINDNAKLTIATSGIYRLWLNGEFVGHGPARAGHGYFRADRWDLSDKLKEGNNIVAIEVAGYNVNSFYITDQPSFLQAELTLNNKIIAYTAGNKSSFEAMLLKERVQKVPRFSFQRPFVEYYRLDENFNRWKDDPDYPASASSTMVNLEDAGYKNIIKRGIPYPDFKVVPPSMIVARGSMTTGIKRESYWKDRAVVNIGPELGGFIESDLEYNPSVELQEMEIKELLPEDIIYSPRIKPGLTEGDFIIYDMGTNLSGFTGLSVEVNEPARLFLCFDEILSNNDVDFKRLGTIGAVTYDLEPGKYQLESIEPYTFKYLKTIVAKGSCTINSVYIRELANPDIQRAVFESDNEKLNRIFAAGKETFRQNAVDIFMDCPHRERAGWLCDSYFTSRVAMDLSGNTLVERNFLENFLLPESFDYIPEGMLPMCYPADHNDGVFIPNWAMWFVIQLEEYLERSGDRQLVNDLKPKVLDLISYFEPFRNGDGLLEKLESWIFIEWSEANRFVQDVNYPTNMLYAAMLDAASRIYSLEHLAADASAIRKTVSEQSFNGEFFCDNAIRNDKGELEVKNNTTEVCQYYAFYFGIASPESHPLLWENLLNHFGPSRKNNNKYPNVYFANSFVGNYLRLELLSRYKQQQKLLNESIDFFDYMAVKTGTLWENIGTYASCNHGFASHIVHILYRDVLGISNIDYKNRKVVFSIPDIELERCQGIIPVGEEIVKLSWSKADGIIDINYSIPEGFTSVIENNSNCKIK